MKCLFKIIILIFVIFIAACSPQKRLSRLIKKHPELLIKDTVFVLDTTFLKEIKFDTTTLITPGTTDTITIIKDKITVKIIRNYDTLKVFLEKPPDTIFKKIPVPVEKIKIVKADYITLFFDNIHYILAILIVIALTLWKIFKR